MIQDKSVLSQSLLKQPKMHPYLQNVTWQKWWLWRKIDGKERKLRKYSNIIWLRIQQPLFHFKLSLQLWDKKDSIISTWQMKTNKKSKARQEAESLDISND